ncbi:MAG: hypothetical protein GXO78_14755 [Calditrichaeota bacterium]|nr:hypothetical protein [Calditrichota bacterium]
MIDTLKIFNELKEKLDPEAALKLAEIIGSVYSELSDTVTKAEFNELKDIVHDLLNAQRQTTDHLNRLLEFQQKVEKQLETLTRRVDQLTVAQQKTEERLNQLAEAQQKTEEQLEKLTQRVDQLTIAQQKTEERLEKLTQRVDQLAEAQRKTEERLEKLTQHVDQLTIAQQKTEERLEKLTQRVDQLAEAQRKTEERLNQLAQAQQKTEERLEKLTQRVDQLTIAQQKTEERLEKLTQRVDQLAEAQQKTEQRLNQLAQAQQKTEERLEQLAEAQRKTEETIRKLTRRVDDIAEQLGGISNTIGYRLEDQAYKPLKQILEKEYRISVDRLYRKNLVYSPKKYDEINIYGEGQRNGNRVFVIGECKAQFGVRDVNRFLKLLERLKSRLEGEIFPITLAYQYHPVAEEILKQKGIRVFWSYEIPNVLPYSDIF